MRIPQLLALTLVCAGCEPFFDPDIAEGEGDFDGIPEDPIHESADPGPGPGLGGLDLDGDGEIDERIALGNLRIVAAERPELVEVLPGPVGVRYAVHPDGVVAFELDGRGVLAELLQVGGHVELLGIVEWGFDGGAPVEAVITAEVR